MTDGPTGYRSKCRIYADILRAVQDSDQAKVTYLLHKANLSHDRLLSHLGRMIGSGLIEKASDGDATYYIITKKGKKYLTEFKNVQEFGDAFGVEI